MKMKKPTKIMSNKVERRKQELLKAHDEYEQSLDEDLTSLSDFAVEWGGRILLIGGSLLISYLGVRAILGIKKKEGCGCEKRQKWLNEFGRWVTGGGDAREAEDA